MSDIGSRWFVRNSKSYNSQNVAKLPVIARTGISKGGDPHPRQQDDQGNTFIVVGETEITEDEEAVVG